MKSLSIDNKAVIVTGKIVKTARLKSEHYVPVGDPSILISQIAATGVPVDLFTFTQEVHDQKPHYDFHQQKDQLAVLPITTYDHWFKNQLYFKPRNKLRKALKNGVQVRQVAFTDELVLGIKQVYDETQIRQGKRNWNYGKDIATLKREHSTFLERSDFIGAFFEGELIGFAKITYIEKAGILMNIVAKNSHRNKAPTNALVAKAVELCAAKGLSHLVYGSWRGRGLQDFKVANGFQQYDLPRYFVPLTLKGRLALSLGLHLKLVDHLPRWCIEFASKVRTQYLSLRMKQAVPAAE